MALRACLLLALLLSASLAPAAGGTHGGTVRVTSDAGFTAAHWSGSGTEADPYRPTFTSIVASGGYGVELSGTQAHVNLTGVTITGGSSVSDAIRLYSVRNVTVHAATLETNRYGIHVRGSSDVVIAASTIKTSQVGVFLESSTDVVVRDNKLSLNERDVELKLSRDNELTRNNLSVATGQYGLYFDDNTSYDNDIDTTNVVNAIPVRWYTGLDGDPGDPLVISGITVDLPRMTNVAQIMVHNSSYVRLEDATAKAGAANGIHLHRTAEVEIVRPTTDGNAASGIMLELANGTSISNASSRNNTLHGVFAQSTRDTLVEWSTANGNRGQGVRAAASARDTTLRQITLASNAAGGVAADRATGLVLEDSSLSSNGATAVALETTSGVELTRNTVAGAGTTGLLVARSTGAFTENVVSGHTNAISFVAATGSNLTSNAITLTRAGTGLAFDGPQSYDNEIAPSNLVNGTAVRWYTRVTGPIALDALTVEQAGITNVGQIVLYRTRNVTLEDPIARNGTASGIVTYLANDTDVTNASIVDNAAHGLLATQSLRLELLGSTILESGGDGVKLVGSPNGLLENNVIQDGRGRGVLAETSSAPTLRGNAITDNAGIGIHLDRVGSGGAAADHNAIERNLGGGIVASASTVGSLLSNTLADNGADGISFSNVANGARIEANEIVNHTRGVRLAGSDGIEVVANTITFGAPNQTGLHFDDEASYAATLTDDNTVNGTPVQWHYGTSGATITAPVVEQRGITNVAQIMLYDVDNVTIQGALAANGTARGIYALRSDNVSIVDSVSRDNARAGIHVESTKYALVDGSSSTDNAQEGFLAKLSGGARVRNSTLADNGGAGVSLDTSPSPGAQLEDLAIARNVMGIVAATSAIARIHNNTIDDNGARGISFAASSDGNVTGNTIAQHARAVHLATSRSITFLDNDVTLSTGQTGWHFEDNTSYNSTVNESNLVNGAPMRWYAHADDLDLTGARAEVRGMTNVAQIMLFRSHRARLEDALAANGTARGIYVYDSDDVEVSGSVAHNNSGEGLAMDQTARLLVSGLAARDNGGAGARVGDESPTLTGSTFQRNARGGIVVEGGTGVLVSDNAVADQPLVGIAVRNSTAAPRLAGNSIENATQGIAFLASEYAVVTDNAISKSAAQTGFHFSDERSYNNGIATSNTVDGAPVHWYTALAGTENDPVTLTGVRSEVAGVTNVAQVMFYRSAYVHAPDVVATNGTARGVYLYRSSSITLDGANASDNALHGVHLQLTQSSSVTDLSAQRSGTGVQLTESHNNVVSGVNASGATKGVGIDALSRDDRVDGVETTGTARGVVDLGWNGQSLLGTNLVLDGGATKRVKVGNALAFNDTMATYRHEASRISSQTIGFGDGSAAATSTAAAILRPSHTYAEAGEYYANLTATTADGLTLSDRVLVQVVPPLTMPRTLSGTPGGRSVTLTWTEPASDGASTITKYRVYRGFNASSAVYIGEVSGGTYTYLDTGLENGRVYTYKVAAVNADGEGPNATTTAKPVSTPAAPTSLAAAARPNATALTWVAPLDTGGQRITGYEILRASAGSAFGLVGSVGNVTWFNATGLTNGVAYTFAVRATSTVGEGALSSNATVTPVGPPSAPLQPRVLAGDATATFVWHAVADEGGTPVLSYRVYRGSTNDTLVALPAVIPVNTTRYRDSGLSNGARYLYAVAAVNAAGEGARSAPVLAVPSAVDELRPIVFDREPAPGAVLAASPAAIRAQYVDNEGIVLESVRVYLDGSQVGAELTDAGLTYVVPAALELGEHVVRVVVRDPEGNEADESWTFRMLSPEEIVPRYEFSAHELVPPRADPGAGVTARVSVRNVGYAAGTISVPLTLNGTVLAVADAALEVGEARDLFLAFDAPATLGGHQVTFAEATLTLLVGGALDEEPEPTNDTNVTQPTRPARDRNVTPRELADADVPFPGAALAILLVAIVALRRRKA